VQGLLKLSRAIDALNERIGGLADWLVFLSVLISAGNAAMRYVLDYSTNGLLEIQWYLFGAAVFLGASYTLKLNEHVRVDIVYSHLSERMRLIIDAVGLLVFLIPAMAFFAWLSWPVFVRAFESGEMSSNYGGLPQWPILLVLPLGFALLSLQGLSELIKRLAALRHEAHVDTHYEKPLQ
jgi:TRAP-type mannitol/chloroaromatic compound transport system permease small subunit